jgi:RimJ/RimL family protein N-acetyltransferase
MREEIMLRNVEEADGETFFLHEQDAEANRMVGFVPRSREEFFASWAKTISGPTGRKQAIVVNGQVVGYVGTLERLGRLEVGFRIGREYWGKGIATRALTQFLTKEKRRPLYAGAAKTNRASIRVLEKCGFVLEGPDQYTNKAGEEIAGFLFRLDAAPNRVARRVAPPGSHTTVHAGPRTAVPGSP